MGREKEMSCSLVSLCRKAGAAALALALFAGSSIAWAGNEEVVGTWDVELDIQGNKVPSKLMIVEKDGALGGTWSGSRGEAELKDVKYEEGKLTFSRSVNFQGQEFDMTFNGKVEGDKISGEFDTQMGPLAMTGTRGGAEAAGGEGAEEMPTGEVNLPGSWHMVVEVQDGSTSEGDLVVKEEGGKLTATWTTDLGTANFPEVKLDGNKVAFAADVDFGGTMVPLKFDGITGGDKIKGTVSLSFDGQEMAMPVTGTRGEGAAVEMLTGPVNLPGKWEVEATLPDGNTSMADFVIEEKEGKLVGKLMTEIGEAVIDGIVVEGNKISYKGAIDMGGVEAPIEFIGSTGGDKMVGDFKLSMEGQEMALPVKGVKGMEVLTGEVKFPGEWEVEASLPDGNTSISMLTIEEKEGKLVGKMSTEIGEGAIESITMNGNEFSFQCNIDMGGVMAPLNVKGSTAGDKLIGKATLSMEGQEMELPLKGSRAAKTGTE